MYDDAAVVGAADDATCTVGLRNLLGLQNRRRVVLECANIAARAAEIIALNVTEIAALVPRKQFCTCIFAAVRAARINGRTAGAQRMGLCRTVVVGERSLSYRYEPTEVSLDLAEDVSDWLRRLTVSDDSLAASA